MAFSAVQICNMALSHLCMGRQIDDLADESQEAVVCSLWYEPTRDYLLRKFPWPFAERIVELALVEQDPNGMWGYSYRLPTDFMRANYLVSGGGRSLVNPLPYKIASDAAGGLLYTDEPNAELCYGARIEDPTFFAPDFADALSLRLAGKIARPLAASASLAEQANEAYKAMVGEATANSLNEERPDADPEAAAVRAREA